MACQVDGTLFIGDMLFMPDMGTASVDSQEGDSHQPYRSIQRICNCPARLRCMSATITRRRHLDNQQEPMRFCHWVKALETWLQRPHAFDTVQALLKPLEALKHDHDFWMPTQGGQAGRKDEIDSEAERFFRAVDRAVLSHTSDLPEHQHLFRAVSHNP